MSEIPEVSKEEICTLYFNDQVRPKHLKEFHKITPEGNDIIGFINKKPNEYLGSMYIHKVNDIVSPQFVYSMPKITYSDEGHVLKSCNADKTSYVHYIAYEKLDGSCLILYPLILHGKVIEIIPKTRNTVVGDKFILNMFSLIDQSRIYSFFQENRTTTLLFELYGVMNKHEILYPKTYIDIKLIGATKNSRICNDQELNNIVREYGFSKPKPLFDIVCYRGRWMYYVLLDYRICDLAYYMPESYERVYYPTQKDCIDAVADILQQINDNYAKEHNRMAIEGCVINGIDAFTGEHIYLKVKPHDFFEKIRLHNGIPRRFITKEVRKYFDEYGSKVKEIYEEDNKHYLRYVKENLLEEFSKASVNSKQTRKKIKNVFFDIWETMTPPKGIQDICHDLINKYPDLTTPELMKKFAEDYPQSKNKARMIFSVMKSIKGD